MNDYLIEVLTKVSFDKGLFQKELNKSKRWLTNEEWDQLYGWAVKNFGNLLIDGNLVNKQHSVPTC